MDGLFAYHSLNEGGTKNAHEIAEAFDQLLNRLQLLCDEPATIPHSREFHIVRTKLEEAAFYAKKTMAKKPRNQAGYPFGAACDRPPAQPRYASGEEEIKP